MTMQLAKIRHLSAVRARSILTAIQAGEQLPPPLILFPLS